MIRTTRDIRPIAGTVIAFAAGLAIGAAAMTALRRPTPETSPPASASDPESLPARSPVLQARALEAIDGDTFEARVATFPGQEIVARVRIAGVDAPERKGRCRQESEAAEAATAALAGLVDGRRLTLSAVRGDKYFGRVVARVSGDGVGDLADALIAGGHGRAYAGGKRGGWC